MYSSKKIKGVSFVALTLAFSLSMSFTQQAFAFIPASEMRDLSSNHWAYKAIKGLVEKYEVMSGYPDKNFKGSRTMTRYELAASLYKVMTKVEELIATATKNAVSETMNYETQKSIVTREDLETIMILQKEFKTEIEQIKTRMTKLEEKVDNLGKVKLGGEIEVKYRDRMFVTDPTNTGSPLNGLAGDGDKGLTRFNDANRNLITEFDRTPFRIKTTLDVNANLAKGLDYYGSFVADDGTIFKLGNTTGEAVGGHFLDEGLIGNSIYPKLSMIRAKAIFDDAKVKNESGKKPGIGVSLGFMNFDKTFKTGTKFRNHFNSEKWVGHGYGLLGFGMDEIATKNITNKDSKGIATVTRNSVSRFWASGIDVSTVDPDSSRFNNVPSPSLMFDATIGPLSIVVGGNAGSPYVNRFTAISGNLGLGEVTNLDKAANTLTSNAQVLTGREFVNDAGGGLINEKVVIGSKDPYYNRTTYNLIPLPSEYGDGYGMVGLDFDLGWLRCALSASDYWLDSTFSLSGTRKSISGVVDIGSDTMGLTLQSNYYAIGLDSYSIGFFANDLAKTGIDIGIGAKTAMRGLFSFGQIVRPNVGFYVALPPFSDSIPRLTFAARQTMGENFGSPKDYFGKELTKVSALKDSGITIGATFEHIAGTDFNIDVEYNGLMEGALWGFNFMAHDIGIFTTYKF